MQGKRAGMEDGVTLRRYRSLEESWPVQSVAFGDEGGAEDVRQSPVRPVHSITLFRRE